MRTYSHLRFSTMLMKINIIRNQKRQSLFNKSQPLSNTNRVTYHITMKQTNYIPFFCLKNLKMKKEVMGGRQKRVNWHFQDYCGNILNEAG